MSCKFNLPVLQDSRKNCQSNIFWTKLIPKQKSKFIDFSHVKHQWSKKHHFYDIQFSEDKLNIRRSPPSELITLREVSLRVTLREFSRRVTLCVRLFQDISFTRLGFWEKKPGVDGSDWLWSHCWREVGVDDSDSLPIRHWRWSKVFSLKEHLCC